MRLTLAQINNVPAEKYGERLSRPKLPHSRLELAAVRRHLIARRPRVSSAQAAAGSLASRSSLTSAL
jgi:hypothetical protein